MLLYYYVGVFYLNIAILLLNTTLLVHSRACHMPLPSILQVRRVVMGGNHEEAHIRMTDAIDVTLQT